ncbi:hypothetical protein DHL47_10385 [Streptococcus panodentis]|uniref:Imm-5-like domain-containing protein n=1 Tax=Streptococcus panodentis TaxID=1581472 RepID=A0ABS5AZL9_9STRE|nr:hypothetical protein [Streptococcus panodentis]MBP2621716.1 hypothetical protein [Streptococcus panodentis]
MRIEDYAWNVHERKLYLNQHMQLPTVCKIKILDDAQKRLELEQELSFLPQKELARWALSNAEDFLELIDIGDKNARADIISQAKTVFQARLDGQASAYELRQAGFLANQLAQQSRTEISKSAARAFAQAVATAHMRGHAIVSADYAVKVRNLQSPDDVGAARRERERQLKLAESYLDRMKFKNR